MRLDRSGVRVRRAIPITLAVLATVQIPLTCVLCLALGRGAMDACGAAPAALRPSAVSALYVLVTRKGSLTYETKRVSWS